MENERYTERNNLLAHIVLAQERYKAGEKTPEVKAQFEAAAAALQQFDAAYPEVKAEVHRRLLKYHAKRQPFQSRA